MNRKALLTLLVVLALLLSGCGKGKKEESGQTTEQTATATQAQQSSQQPQMQLPKLEPKKVQKAIDALDDFSKLIKSFQNKPQPSTPEELQKSNEEAMAEIGKLAQRSGFDSAEEQLVYTSTIIQIALLQQAKKSMEAQMPNLPEDQKNSPQMQAQIQNINSQYAQLKNTYSKDIFDIIDKNMDKIDGFIKQQQQLQMQQQANKAQSTPPPPGKRQ